MRLSSATVTHSGVNIGLAANAMDDNISSQPRLQEHLHCFHWTQSTSGLNNKFVTCIQSLYGLIRGARQH